MSSRSRTRARSRQRSTFRALHSTNLAGRGSRPGLTRSQAWLAVSSRNLRLASRSWSLVPLVATMPPPLDEGDAKSIVCFSTGYQVNLGVISCLLSRHDTAYLDSMDHASILDGVRLGFGKCFKFKHNDTADLEGKLERTRDAKGKLIEARFAKQAAGAVQPCRSTKTSRLRWRAASRDKRRSRRRRIGGARTRGRRSRSGRS